MIRVKARWAEDASPGERILMEVVVNLSELKEERFSSCNMSPDELLSDKLSSGSKLVNMRLF